MEAGRDRKKGGGCQEEGGGGGTWRGLGVEGDTSRNRYLQKGMGRGE